MTKITQADRDAADEIMEEVDACGCKLCGMRVCEAFARHRMEERAAIVAWLRKAFGEKSDWNVAHASDFAQSIEAGEHLK